MANYSINTCNTLLDIALQWIFNFVGQPYNAMNIGIQRILMKPVSTVYPNTCTLLWGGGVWIM